jgi:hypothetical protein
MNLTSGVAGQPHRLGVHLVRLQQVDSLGPHVVGFAHRDPDVGEKHVAAANGLTDVLRDRDLRTRLARDRTREVADLVARP